MSSRESENTGENLLPDEVFIPFDMPHVFQYTPEDGFDLHVLLFPYFHTSTTATMLALTIRTFQENVLGTRITNSSVSIPELAEDVPFQDPFHTGAMHKSLFSMQFRREKTGAGTRNGIVISNMFFPFRAYSPNPVAERTAVLQDKKWTAFVTGQVPVRIRGEKSRNEITILKNPAGGHDIYSRSDHKEKVLSTTAFPVPHTIFVTSRMLPNTPNLPRKVITDDAAPYFYTIICYEQTAYVFSMSPEEVVILSRT